MKDHAFAGPDGCANVMQAVTFDQYPWEPNTVAILRGVKPIALRNAATHFQEKFGNTNYLCELKVKNLEDYIKNNQLHKYMVATYKNIREYNYTMRQYRTVALVLTNITATDVLIQFRITKRDN